MALQVNIGKVLFMDIETVPQHASFHEQPETLQKLWEKKAKYIQQEDQTAADVYRRAGIYAEFGKIVCISVGAIRMIDGNRQFRVKSFFGDDEKKLLSQFSNLLQKHYNSSNHLLCAHNGKEFDFPYICRRLIVHDLPIPDILNIQGKKPWEIAHLDTLDLWKFGDYKHYTSLELLAYIFGIKTPKDDIDGSEVASVYWDEKDLPRIAAYCQKDTLTIAQILLKYLRMPMLKETEISMA